MKLKGISVLVGVVLLQGACVSKDSLKKQLKENPDIVFEAMKENPEAFMMALQETADRAQKQRFENRALVEKKRREADLKRPKKPSVDNSRLIYGQSSSPITIVKYADFQCPACRVGYESLNEVKKKYGDKVKIIHKHMPLEGIHPLAREAAWIYEALLIKDKGKARKFYNAAYEGQRSWSTKKELWAIARKSGATKKLINSKQSLIQKRIKADMQEHGKFGFQGTPAYLINGVSMYGAQSPQAMGEVIDQLLKK